MYEVSEDQLGGISERYKGIYNHNKFNEFATDFILISSIVPNMKEFKIMNDNEQSKTIETMVKNSLRKVSHEIQRCLRLTSEYLKTNYIKDLFRIYNIYYRMVY